MSNIPYFSAFDLAYYAVHRKSPPGQDTKLIDPPFAETTKFNGMVVETVLETQWLEALCSIQRPDMRMISISAGRSKFYLTHIVFLLVNMTESKIADVNYKFDPYMNVMSAYTNHTDNSYFVAVSTRNWYRYGTTENTKWTSWWENIVEIIESAVTG